MSVPAFEMPKCREEASRPVNPARGGAGRRLRCQTPVVPQSRAGETRDPFGVSRAASGEPRAMPAVPEKRACRSP